MENNQLLNQEIIIHQAIELLNTVGLEKLSMRNLASRLNIKASSLYWYFKNKDELLLYISDEICKRIDHEPLIDSPSEELKLLLINYRNILNSIRDSTIIMQQTPPITCSRQLLINRVFQLIQALGVEADKIFIASSMVNNYVLSFVQDEIGFKQLSESNDISIPGLDLPNFSFNLDEEFIKGIDILLKGLTNSQNSTI